MKQLILILLFLNLFSNLYCQADKETRIYTADIGNYWNAFDSIASTVDSARQIEFIQTLYIDKASKGLKEFIRLRNFKAAEWVRNIKRFPKFWNSIREKTEAIIKYRAEIEILFNRFKELYPGLDQPDIYFTIGCLRSGGTTSGSKILIGSEIAAADSSTDAAEIGHWLQAVFASGQGILFYVIHETVHIQQKNESSELLGKCIREGAADFIAEIILQKPLTAPYIIYGKANEKAIVEKFMQVMYQSEHTDWLSNGGKKPKGEADLGYFIGYSICSSFYNRAIDKKQALREIIELKFSSEDKVHSFFELSGYAEKWK